MPRETDRPRDDDDAASSEDFARQPGRLITTALWLVGTLGLGGTRIEAAVEKVLGREKRDASGQD